MKSKVTVVGSGYVGTTISVMLSQYHDVIVLDVDKVRVEQINNKVSPVRDKLITSYLREKELSLSATMDENIAYENADFIIMATPTNYNPDTNFFDTSTLRSVIKKALSVNNSGLIVIKSTIPIGFVNQLSDELGTDRIIFSPEFLREGIALYDNLYPSRIIVGGHSKSAKAFGSLMVSAAEKPHINLIFMSSTEAEAVKLFSNSYLAMRVGFFNELDSFALSHALSSKNIIEGVSYDPRIGSEYNNPSFGYGGYCLPKDTKQLLANYSEIPNSNIIAAIVDSNESRKDFLAQKILETNPRVVGAYRLIMKDGSDNFRESAIQDVIKKLSEQGIDIVVYEPQTDQEEISGFRVIHDWHTFAKLSDVILANRYDSLLDEVSGKVFTRDVFNNN
jgi:UDPglucose 6-dehydrogenase